MSLFGWLRRGGGGKELPLGASIPDVSALDDQEHLVRLSDFAAAPYLLVFFYPKANTSGCTAQACSLRDDFAVLSERGVQVLGISTDSPIAQRHFREKRRLPYALLADQQHRIGRAFGVPLFLGLYRREAFLFRQGKLVWRDVSASTSGQARDVLREVDRR